MTTNQKISLAILAQMANGKDVMDAMKAVLGRDLVDQMISELYDELRAKAAAQ